LARQMGEKEEFGVLVLRPSLPGDADEHAKFMGARHCRVIVVRRTMFTDVCLPTDLAKA
jgi:hypothetical protein